MEISTMNNGNVYYSIEIAHGAFMLVEQLTAEQQGLAATTAQLSPHLCCIKIELPCCRKYTTECGKPSGMSSMLRVWHRYKKGAVYCQLVREDVRVTVSLYEQFAELISKK